jgi:phospholipid-binding lipoprotein MlaA
MTRLIALCLLLLAGGCATTGEGDPRDPLEPFNRAMFSFNDGLDEAVARPVATAYHGVVPGPLRTYVRNFFSNIADLFIGLNNILQGKPDEGLQDWARFVFNSFFGVFGINDVASDMGLEKHNEDFGQTFGRWGIGEGAYLVLPLLGPSTLRDGAGTALDVYFDPVGEFRPVAARNLAVSLRLVGTRADLLDASRILEEAALDRYVFVRDAFLQRRRSLVYDGQPPRERRPRDEDEPAPAGDKPPAEPPKYDPPEKRGAAPSVNVADGSNVNIGEPLGNETTDEKNR